MRQAAGHFFEEDTHFHTANVFAHTLMRAIAKGQVIHRVIAVNVECGGVLKMAVVLIARGLHDQQFRAFGQVNAVQGGRGGGLPPPCHDGPGIAQAFFDGVGDQGRIGANVIPRLTVGQQGFEHVG